MSRRQVLLVESDADLRRALWEILRDDGYGVTEAASEAEAFVWLTTAPAPCVILLSLFSPGIDGAAFFGALRRNPKLATVPVVVLVNTAEDEAAAPVYGATIVLARPLDLTAIIDAVARACA